MVAIRTRTVALVALFLLLTIAPGVAAADEIDKAEFSSRLEQAIGGDDSGLRAVTAVDGTPVDTGSLLSGSTIEREARLDTLRRSLRVDSGIELDSSTLRREAAEIVSNPPYSAEATTDSDIFGRIIGFFARLLGNDAARGFALVIVAVVALAIAIPLLNRLANQRRRRAADVTEPVFAHPDYGAAADEAAERGEYAEAVRMLFRDGVDHLESARAVPDADTTTTATVRQISGDQPFLDRFDEIAYGGSPADGDDVSRARSGWQQLKRRWR